MPEQPGSSPDAEDQQRFSLDELATLANVTPRTVRYYIAEGLVDRPEGEKRGAHYLRRHLEQLLLIRRWTEAGLSLERIRELIAGAPEDPPPRRTPPGAVEVWSRITLTDGLEVHIEPGRADLGPEQVRSLVRGLKSLYQQVRHDGRRPNRPALPAPQQASTREKQHDQDHR